jgi:hypothetical protein
MPGRRRTSPSAAAEGDVTLKLAHHLNEGNPYTGEAQIPGDEVVLPRAQAASLIASGYAAVDAEDPVAVAVALGDPAPHDDAGGEPDA